MKVVFLIVLLLIPAVFSLHGGETATYNFTKCEELTVEVNATPSISYGELILKPNCVEIDVGYFECICQDNYKLNITSKPNAVGSYSIKFSYSYFNDTEEVEESFDSTENFTWSYNSSTPTTTTTIAQTTTTIAVNVTNPEVLAETTQADEQSKKDINLLIVLIPITTILITLGVLYVGSKGLKKPSKESTDTLEPQN